MLDILQEGPGWAVVNKPAGIATERHFQYDTVEARAQVQWKREGAAKPPFVGIVHRLDRVTSGALLLARKKSTLVKLNGYFADRRSEKTYWAVTSSALPDPQGELHDYLLRDATRKQAVVSRRPVPGGKEALLTYELLHTENDLHLYSLRPTTGRFHQLRAQLAAAGAPIFGDATYGSDRLLGAHRIALHARTLSFPGPDSPEGRVEVMAPLPDYWPLNPQQHV
jgi:23S rRNA pseudouridine1911/1915/1917 synthase